MSSDAQANLKNLTQKYYQSLREETPSTNPQQPRKKIVDSSTPSLLVFKFVVSLQ
jgi:hypothetical protein